jgi:type 1 glutamine amidotransferase
MKPEKGAKIVVHFKKIVCLAVIGSFFGTAFSQSLPIPQARERLITVGGKQKKVTSKLVKNRKVLVPEFFWTYDHSIGRPEVDRLLGIISQTDSIQFTYITDVNNFDPATFSQYPVILANNITNLGAGSLGATKQNAVQSYIENGGGFMIIHGSGDTKAGGSWSWYASTLHPVVYNGEAVIGQNTRVFQPVSNKVLGTALPAANATHPIMESISHDTTMQEEFHNFEFVITDKVPSADVLLLVDHSTYNCSGCSPSPDHPVAWTFKIQKGTVVYSGPGHSNLITSSWGRPNPTDARGPYWQRFLKQSLYWAAGYDTTDVTGTDLKNKAEEYQFYQSGVAFHPRDMNAVFTEAGPHSVQVLNMQGKILARENASGPKEHAFDRTRFRPGIYILRAVTTKGVQSKQYLIGG